ncbi:MAG: Fic family protein [Candidatus Eremiobacteraeota bacterium]|nr:Fic family protein [Candidatus Eremiobacteraeota bacterium]
MGRRLEALAALVRGAPPSAALRRAHARLRRDEILGATRLAGARLDATDLGALLDHGRALGGHRLDDYLLAGDYAEAASWAAQRAQRPAPVTTEDVRVLHRLALRRTSDAAGAWRTRTLPARADGTVAPPHWLVPFETETYVGRLALLGDEPVPLAAALAIARLVRLAPFACGNGRVARLVGNLIAMRRGYPPAPLDARAQRAYPSTVEAALAGDPLPLARLFARALGGALERLRDAAEGEAELVPLGRFAGEGSADRLYKAANRGRLRVVRRAGRLYTTAEWFARYDHPSGRRRRFADIKKGP